MKNSNKLYEMFVHSGSILALSASGMGFTASVLMGSYPPWELLAVLFLITAASYNINRYAELSTEDLLNHPKRTKFFTKYRVVVVFGSVFAFLLAFGLTIFKAGIGAAFVLAIAPTSVAVYSLKWIPIKNASRFKEFFLFKNLWSALIWAIIPIVTFYFIREPTRLALLTCAVLIFLRFFINTVIFDMRDVVGDVKYKVKTLPTTLGFKQTRNILLVVNTLAGLFLLFATIEGWVPKGAYSLNLITLYGYWMIMETTNRKTNFNFLCDVIVDGEFILWVPLIIVGIGLF